MELFEKVMVVTGAGSGIGQAIAIESGRQRMKVVCAGRRVERLEQTTAIIREAGGEALAVGTDVADRRQVEHMVQATLDRFGQIDVLYNNAARFNVLGGLWEVDPDDWWQDVTTNVRGPMLCMHYALPHMMKRNSGVIVNMNGGGSTVPLAGGSGYGCSKAALLRLTESTAKELERVGSAVMALSLGPGFVRTETTMLQATTDQGIKWIPSSKELIEAGKTRPPTDCARSTMELLTHLVPEFNGRYFGTGEDFAALAARRRELVEKDLHVMRGR